MIGGGKVVYAARTHTIGGQTNADLRIGTCGNTLSSEAILD
jgi:hypothetical protein